MWLQMRSFPPFGNQLLFSLLFFAVFENEEIKYTGVLETSAKDDIVLQSTSKAVGRQ